MGVGIAAAGKAGEGPWLALHGHGRAGVVLRAAARSISIAGACRDLANGPSDQALMTDRKQRVTFLVTVGYRRHRNRRDGKQLRQKLLFATWRVHGSPTEIRKRYRLRFGIETSFRQMRQARIYTCTRNPRLRLFFIAVALILRNLWVWIHHTHLAERSGDNLILHLEMLRFKQMLEWIIHEVIALLYGGSTPCAVRPP